MRQNAWKKNGKSWILDDLPTFCRAKCGQKQWYLFEPKNSLDTYENKCGNRYHCFWPQKVNVRTENEILAIADWKIKKKTLKTTWHLIENAVSYVVLTTRLRVTDVDVSRFILNASPKYEKGACRRLPKMSPCGTAETAVVVVALPTTPNFLPCRST